MIVKPSDWCVLVCDSFFIIPSIVAKFPQFTRSTFIFASLLSNFIVHKKVSDGQWFEAC